MMSASHHMWDSVSSWRLSIRLLGMPTLLNMLLIAFGAVPANIMPVKHPWKPGHLTLTASKFTTESRPYTGAWTFFSAAAHTV